MTAAVAPHFRSVQSDSWSILIPEFTGHDGNGGTSKASSHLSPSNIRRLQAKKVSDLPVISGTDTMTSRFLRNHGKKPQALHATQLHQAAGLKEEMSSLKLAEHFDRHGKPRFQRLGLAFLVKSGHTNDRLSSQTTRREEESAASKCSALLADEFADIFRELEEDNRNTAKEAVKAAKTYFLAQEALAQDALNWKAKAQRWRDAVQEHDKLKKEDVHCRQVDACFQEVPHFRQYVPQGVEFSELESAVENEEEAELCRYAPGRAASLLNGANWIMGNSMNWELRQSAVMAISACAHLWSSAAWHQASHVGIDRSTFCRFVIETGLIKPEKAPLCWAVSFFDRLAHPMRLCKPAETNPHLCPLKFVVNRWELISILDLIIAQHWKKQDDKTRFILGLLEIAKTRLPSYAFVEAGVDKARWELLARGLTHSGAPHHAAPTAGETAKAPRPSPAEATAPVQTQPAPNVTSQNIEVKAREFRMYSMLYEPEVLSLLWQHARLFEEIHTCYADVRGQLNFPALVQLCSDFHLAPRLISAQILANLFETTQCLDVSQLLAQRQRQSPPPSREAPINHSHRSGILIRQSAPQWQSRARHSALPTVPRESQASCTSTSSREVVLPPGFSTFGPSALMEFLCRVAFTYLGYYGNMRQSSMPSHLQIVWLLVNMRFAWENLRSQMQKAGADTGSLDATGCGSLAQVLKLSPDIWQPQPVPAEQVKDDNAIAAIFRTRLNPTPENCGLPAARPPSFAQINAGAPGTLCVVNGTCRVCLAPARSESWGNIRCYGCSKLDCLHLQDHPLAKLLAYKAPKLKLEAGQADLKIRARRCPLAPPPFGFSNALKAENS